MSGTIKLCFLIIALSAVLANAQQLQKRAISSHSDKLQLADDAIQRDRISRQSKKTRTTTPRPLGFFGTVKKLLFDQINDTKSAYSQLSELFSSQFSDSTRKTTSRPPVTITTDETMTTTTEVPKLSRAELYDILRRNLIGLRRLYQLEVREAIKDSRKNIADYQREFHQKLYQQFAD